MRSLSALLLGATVGLSSVAAAEVETVKAKVEVLVTAVKKNPSQVPNIAALSQADEAEVVSLLDQHIERADGRVKTRLCSVLGTLAKRVQSPAVKQKIASRLVKQFMQGDDVPQYYLSTAFSPRDVAAADKAAFTEYFYDKAWPKKIHRTEGLLLFAALGLEDELPRLEKLFNATKWPPEGKAWNRTLKWTFSRVLARLGDKDSVDYCIKKVNDEPDLRTKAVAILDMDFLRTPMIVPLLQNALNSDLIVEEPHHKVPLAQYAAKALSRLLVDFPRPKSKYGVYATSDVAKCRKWMAGQTEWKIREP